MYTAFYGLREKPFALSPDPRFLYLAGSHREALAHLLYGIEQGEGFISVTGEVGTGKTTLCRTLLERLDGDTELAFLFNPSRTALELLQSICAEFALPAEGLTRRALMTQLDAFLVEQKQAGRRVLLIIDEAQTLSDNTLEQVRLLSNLETSREKLIQILLLGQPELDRKLDGRGLRQLRQRISVRWKLEPLSPEETCAYVRHRLAIAAGVPKDLFSDSALRIVHRRTGGIPRLVNQLCDRALLAGYAARAAKIGPKLIRAAAREIPDARNGRAREIDRVWKIRPMLFSGATLAVVCLAALAGLEVGRHGLTRVPGAFVSESEPNLARASVEAGTGSALSPPSVGANATAQLAATPLLARPIGFVPADATLNPYDASLQVDARPFAAGLLNAIPEGVIAAAQSIGIPAPPKSSVTALAPGLFTRLLANRDAKVAMAESQRAIFEGFGRRVTARAAPPLDAESLQSGIESRGLAATPFEGGSIALLRRLDHPVLLSLTPSDAAKNPRDRMGAAAIAQLAIDSRWLALTRISGNRAHVAGLLNDRIVTVPVQELADHWLETGIIVWERFERVPELLASGAEGRGVLWLQRSLAELNLLNARPTGRFDDPTRSALTRFQSEQGLVADGIAGPLTQIALYGQLDRYPVPRLSDRDHPRSNPRSSDHAPTSTSQTRSRTFDPTATQKSDRPAGDRG